MEKLFPGHPPELTPEQWKELEARNAAKGFYIDEYSRLEPEPYERDCFVGMNRHQRRAAMAKKRRAA